MTAGFRARQRTIILLIIALLLVPGIGALPVQPTGAQTTYDLLVSISANRSNAAPLQDRTVAGDIYVFTAPDTANIARVRFWIDEPAMSGTPWRTENSGPYDLNGGSVSLASAFNSDALEDGEHSITAAIELNDGPTVVVTSSFTVRNQSTGTGAELVFNPKPLVLTADTNGGVVAETAMLAAADGSAATFTLTDNVTWLSASPSFGATPAIINLSANPAGLVPGSYNATVSASASGYTSGELSVILYIPEAAADQIHLSWTGDTSTTLTVIWRTQDATVPSEAQVRPSGTSTWSTIAGAPRPSRTAGTLHEVTFSGLTPDTEYDYRVRESATTWSMESSARTAPPAGAADFDFVYVSDTGLIGRTDGLTPGTRQVIDELVAIDPLLVLGGGDYSYFNTDKRFGTLNNTTDVWFNQMQPLISGSPFMPAYGNHEDSLHENFYNWSARFATPAGFDERRNYSFDIGDVHFISIYAVINGHPLPTATADWLRQDILDAYARGQRWIVPYFHVSPFSDGANHPSNTALRRQLGPMFEDLGVKIVISSHDQSYERTYPLVDVPDTNTPTTFALDCYSMADGVTWIKVSPGGKLSNINGTFSQWETEPPPAWTAVRDNTMHHYLHGLVSADGSVEIRILGVDGNGSPPVVIDQFKYSATGCGGGSDPPAAPSGLTATASESGIALEWNDNAEPDLVGYHVYRGSSDSGPFSRVTPSPISASEYLDLGAPVGLEMFYQVTAVSAGGESLPSSASATRTSSPPSAYELLVSTTPDRTTPIALDGQTVSDTIFIFTSPDTSTIQRVRFWLDDPTMSASPWRTENSAPYDFNGGGGATAAGFDTTSLTDGEHVVTAQIQFTDGSFETVQAIMTVDNTPSGDISPPATPANLIASGSDSGIALGWDENDEPDLAGYHVYRGASSTGPFTRLTSNVLQTPGYVDVAAPAGSTSYYQVTALDLAGNESTPAEAQADRPPGGPPPVDPYQLVFSKTSDRAVPLPLDGSIVNGNMFAFTAPDTAGILRVSFYLDDPAMQNSPRLTENNPPYDFNGGTVSAAKAFDTRTLTNGTHTITAAIQFTNGSIEDYSATFTVAN